MQHKYSSSGIVRPPGWGPGMDMRTWLIGCAISNPNIVKSPDPTEAIDEASRFADNIISAMRSSPSSAPAPDSMLPPSEETLEKWEKNLQILSEKKEATRKETMPAIPVQKKVTIYPPVQPNVSSSLQEAKTKFSNATSGLRKASNANIKAIKPDGRYTMLNVPNDEISPKQR